MSRPICDLGPHCWRDSFGKTHYELRTHHLKALVEFVEQGNLLRDHDDISQEIPNAIDATSTPITCPLSTTCLEIPSSQERTVRVYSEWQQSKVDNDMLKEEIRRACDVALQDGLDLEQVHQD
ncbi:hypothetical protein CC78DRAFT_587394 [Lojkania enalia]|uniref:Uncharacterized protein n=1 Tax=Lojkania enalia TaxID=147567 RepID=A0A9P4K2D9_9PLEO|nr:hypothetical protein CC78DRAFT_587394 [Didymosphaeria enalia]